eukprot:scaffold50732_cov63-Cyclotella_meneghiniana.AAC.2
MKDPGFPSSATVWVLATSSERYAECPGSIEDLKKYAQSDSNFVKKCKEIFFLSCDAIFFGAKMIQILRHKYTEELAEYSVKYGSKHNPMKETKMDEDQSMRRPLTCKPFLSELAQKESIVKYFVKAFDEAMAFNFGDDLYATLLQCIKKQSRMQNVYRNKYLFT